MIFTIVFSNRYALVVSDGGQYELFSVDSSSEVIKGLLAAKLSDGLPAQAYLMRTDDCYAAISTGFPLTLVSLICF